MIGRRPTMGDAVGSGHGQASRHSFPLRDEILADWQVYFKPPVFGKGYRPPNFEKHRKLLKKRRSQHVAAMAARQ